MGSLTLRGMLLDSAANATDALAAYEHAVTAFYTHFPNATEPPKFLLLLRNMLRDKLQIP